MVILSVAVFEKQKVFIVHITLNKRNTYLTTLLLNFRVKASGSHNTAVRSSFIEMTQC